MRFWVLGFKFWQGYCEGDVPLNLGTLMTSVDTEQGRMGCDADGAFSLFTSVAACLVAAG